MTPEVRELCQEVILDHGKTPRTFHELTAARNAVSCERFGGDLPIKRIERRSSVITLTPSARQAAGEILAQQELPPTAALRLGVTTEGSEGRATQFKYVLDFDPNPGKASDGLRKRRPDHRGGPREPRIWAVSSSMLSRSLAGCSSCSATPMRRIAAAAGTRSRTSGSSSSSGCIDRRPSGSETR